MVHLNDLILHEEVEHLIGTGNSKNLWCRCTPLWRQVVNRII